MSDALSPQTEQFIAEALAAGRFASRSELIEAAVFQLREELQFLTELQTPEEVEESLRRCDRAIADLEAGRGIPWNAEEMKRTVRETLEKRAKAQQ